MEMKHLKIAFLALLLIPSFSNVNAQDQNNPWAISIGINAVDFYPSHFDKNNVPGLGSNFDEFFNAGDHYNTLPSLSKITVSKYLADGFSFEAGGTLNKITKIGDNIADDLSYYGIDGAVKYDLNKVIGDTSWFNPYASVGGGYTWIDKFGTATINGSLGINFWINDNIGLNIETKLKQTFESSIEQHFQHSVGVVIKFGGTDTDTDGVYDKFDACLSVFGLAEYNGCPDSDSDGIIDSKDACPNTAGLATLNGCPDIDEDGITDKDDACPNAKGTKANKGCPDTDGDGIVDKDDKCPKTPGKKENNGCLPLETQKELPNEFVEVREQVLMNVKNIYFDLNSSYLMRESTLELNKIVQIMLKYPKLIVEYGSHTDSRASNKYNLWLSKRRAKRTVDYIISKGISPKRISGKGFGETQLINKCVENVKCSEAEHQENRRTEIIIVNPEVIN